MPHVQKFVLFQQTRSLNCGVWTLERQSMKIGCPHSCPFGFLCKPSGFLCLPRSFEPLFSISDRIYYYSPQLSFFQTVRKDVGPKGVVLVIIGNHDDRIFILESIIQIAVDINVKVFQFGISCLKVTQLCHKCQSWCSRKQPEKKKWLPTKTGLIVMENQPLLLHQKTREN